METTDPRSLAIARVHMEEALRKVGHSVAFHWGSDEAHQAILTEALTTLGFDTNAGSKDFEVPPVEMEEAAVLLVLTKTGIKKLNGVTSGYSSASPNEP